MFSLGNVTRRFHWMISHIFFVTMQYSCYTLECFASDWYSSEYFATDCMSTITMLTQREARSLSNYVHYSLWGKKWKHKRIEGNITHDSLRCIHQSLNMFILFWLFLYFYFIYLFIYFLFIFCISCIHAQCGIVSCLGVLFLFQWKQPCYFMFLK